MKVQNGKMLNFQGVKCNFKYCPPSYPLHSRRPAPPSEPPRLHPNGLLPPPKCQLLIPLLQRLPSFINFPFNLPSLYTISTPPSSESTAPITRGLNRSLCCLARFESQLLPKSPEPRNHVQQQKYSTQNPTPSLVAAAESMFSTWSSKSEQCPNRTGPSSSTFC